MNYYTLKNCIQILRKYSFTFTVNNSDDLYSEYLNRYFQFYYRASIYTSEVLGVVILSVRLSVRLPRAYFLTKPNNALRTF